MNQILLTQTPKPEDLSMEFSRNMSRNILNYGKRMSYDLRTIVIITKRNKFMYFSDIDTITSVYGIILIGYYIANKL